MMSDQTRGLTHAVLKALAEPFAPNRIEWKPQKLTSDRARALAVAYIDARDVMERLDSTVGGDWEFRWEPVDADVKGRLTIYGVSREDVGEQGDGSFGATRKAAVSDALKRCGVQFGIGRYLYDLPAVWVDYDERKKAIVNPPDLPQWAVPAGADRGHPSPIRTQQASASENAIPIPASLSEADARRWTAMVKAGLDPLEGLDFRSAAGARSIDEAEADVKEIETGEDEAEAATGGIVSKEQRIDSLRKYIRSGINQAYTRPASDKQAGSVASCLDALFFGEADARTLQRHDFMAWAVGKDSVTKLTSGEASALIDWAIVGKDEETGKTDWSPRQDAIKAAQAVIKWLDEQKGQAPLGLGEDDAPEVDDGIPF